MRNYYILGDWNAICQRCGFKHKASMMKLEWDGLRVCTECFERRHPADLIQIREDNPATPWASPEQIDIFVSTGDPLYTENDNVLFTQSGLVLLTES